MSTDKIKPAPKVIYANKLQSQVELVVFNSEKGARQNAAHHHKSNYEYIAKRFTAEEENQ